MSNSILPKWIEDKLCAKCKAKFKEKKKRGRKKSIKTLLSDIQKQGDLERKRNPKAYKGLCSNEVGTI